MKVNSKWDVAQTYRDYLDGQTFKQIALDAGVTGPRAQQIIEKARKHERTAMGLQSCVSTPESVLIEDQILEGREITFFGDDPCAFHFESKKRMVGPNWHGKCAE